MTKDEALKMAIETLEAFEITGYCDETIQACKEALEQPAQGMKAVSYPKDNKWIDMEAPPAPSWQGLSDKEYMVLASNFTDDENMVVDEIGFAHAIEQALRNKNE